MGSERLIGLLIIAGGCLLWYVDWMIFSALGSLAAWVAKTAGAAEVTFGFQVLAWILGAGIMISIAVMGLVVVIAGLEVLFD